MFDCAMGEDLPLLTMVKSKEIDDLPVDLSESLLALRNTLSTLCSFYSVEDFVGFLFSDGFQNLINYESPWIVFEVGLYLEHNKNMQLIPMRNKIILVDNVGCEWNGGTFESNNPEDILRELKIWCEMVFNPNSRFE